MIIVHCSATPVSMDIGVDEIRKWHKARGWRDVGYHYVITLDGTLQQGRPEGVPGAHAKGFNTSSIGICYVGGVDENMKPLDTRTEDQKLTMMAVIESILEDYPFAVVIGHRDLPNVAKACPSFDVQTWMYEEAY